MSGNTKEIEGQGDYSFLLFVAGDEPNSLLAKKNLQYICKKHLGGRCSINIVDVIEDFDTAIDNGIIVTPTLVITRPEPRVTIFGNLNDIETVISALRMNGEAQ